MNLARILLSLFILHASFIRPSLNSVSVEVLNLKSSKGFVLVSLYNNAKDFPKDAGRAIGKGKSTIENGKAIVTFNNLPNGKYAAAILHDENNNLKMDFNIVGMPKEGYGFSNDARGLFGPPSFEKAAFNVDGEKRIVIRTSYFFR
jgi:uncharacterized protein (DUF2141 family)